jgi:uncharacterized membrane protein YfcA
MSGAKALVLVPLALLGGAFSVFWVRALRARTTDRGVPSAAEIAIGAVTDFLDTLGIGSFATTTSLYRMRATTSEVPDRLLPGTLNVGHTLPTIVQALIYIGIIEVDVLTLVLLIGASVLGALLGAEFVSRWSERRVQIGMAIALLAASVLMLARALPQLGLLPPGGDADALHGASLWIGIAGNFALGALMTMGIGLYAPCMILVSLLGMSPKAAFPIMMGSCAFLMPGASVRFARRHAYAPRAALGLTLGGVPAVLVAAYIVKELPLDVVRWLVLGVVLYTALALVRAARN